MDAVGLTGSVLIAIPGGNAPGEIVVIQRGMLEAYIAYASEPLGMNEDILIITDRGGRQVDVVRWFPVPDGAAVAGH